MRSAMAMTVRSGGDAAGPAQEARERHRRAGVSTLSMSCSSASKVKICSACCGALLLDDGLEQLLLALEVDVERALGDAGLAGDVAHAGGIEALRQEHAARAVDDLAPLARLSLLRCLSGLQRLCVSMRAPWLACRPLGRLDHKSLTEPFGH